MKTKADKLELIKAAMGEIPCDKTIVNVRHVNVFTGEILKAEVDIYKGYVISVRTGNEPSLQKAKEIIDGEGLYMIPGYVDTHMHIESTMLLPENFARVSIPWGTTCINHDPHEIGNVLGIDGIRFMIDNGKKTLEPAGKLLSMPNRSASCWIWKTSRLSLRSWTSSASSADPSACTTSSKPANRNTPSCKVMPQD